MILPDIVVKKQWDARVVTFETSEELTNSWLAFLGGTVLVAKELHSSEGSKENVHLNEAIPKLLQKEMKDAKRKALFSFRCFGVERSEIRVLYRTCKQYLKNHGIASRYIGNERHPAKPGTLLIRGIPGPGNSEIVILREQKNKHVWVGKTCAVQDIESYTARDMGKPFRDTRTGLMPPKLAQVLLNLSLSMLPSRNDANKEQRSLAAIWEKAAVWDPFCGSGVIVLEALLRRAHVLGSDRTQRAVDGCGENVKWLRLREKTPKAITSSIWKQNAVKPCELPKQPTVIVTETSLGPALERAPTKKDIAAFMRETEQLEEAFFRNMSVLVPNAPIVCTFPVFIARDGEKSFLPNILRKIEKLGYRQTCVRTKFVKPTDRLSFLYLRPDQHVGREILCFLPPRKHET